MLALKNDGTVIGWGYNCCGQASPPSGNDYVTISAGGFHSLALKSGGTLIYDYNNYDKVGNRLSMKINDANTQVYGYDKLYQLLNVDYNDGNATGYDYDELGNRTSVTNGGTTTYASNALNQYVKVADINYEYDKNGNLTFDGVYRYYYDCENRLMDVNNANDEAIVSYKYDYEGRRVRKTVNGGQTTVFCYDGDQIIADYNEAGTLQRRYYYGPGIDEPICMVRILTPYYYHFDGLGSVVALSDSGRNVKELYSYDVFGKPTIKAPSGEPRVASDVNNRYMFTGREFEPETGLYYYRARYYHPTLGRFISADPSYHSDGINIYTYVKNNPVNRVDPNGLGDYWKCVKDSLKEAGTGIPWDIIGLYAACVAGCGLVTGGVGVAPCLAGCAAAVGGGILAGILAGCAVCS